MRASDSLADYAQVVKYQSFSLKNFKGVGELTLDLAGPVTTLVGLNESGKTTILEGIFCFTYGRENLDGLNPDLKSLRDPQQWIPVAQRGNFNGTIEIGAVVNLDETDINALRKFMLDEEHFELHSFPNQVRIAEVYKFSDSKYEPNAEETKKVWAVDPLDGRSTIDSEAEPVQDFDDAKWQAAMAYLAEQLPAIWYFPNFLFDLPDTFRVALDPTLDDDGSNAVYQQTFEEVLKEVGQGTNLGRHVIDRVHSSETADKVSLDSVLLDMGRVITNAFFEGWSRIFGRHNSNLEIQVDAVPAGLGEADLSLRIKSRDGYFDLRDRSLGFRWFFMFLLMTRYRGLDSTQRQVVFLLDEPASNLHSSAQAQLLESFDSLAKSCQLIYTTHSHHLINLDWLEGAYVVANDAISDASLDGILEAAASDATTDISASPYRRFVNENPGKTSYFQPVLDLLQYRPSELEPVPEAVLLEGKSDFALLRYCAEVLGLGEAPILVPGLSATTMGSLIALHLGWGKDFVVLLDSDAAGVEQAARYTEEFGPMLTKRIVMLSDVAQADVTAIESLLTKTDRKAIIDAVLPPKGRPSEKKALYQALQELLATGQEVKLGPTSTKQVSAVLAGLKERVGQDSPKPDPH